MSESSTVNLLYERDPVSRAKAIWSEITNRADDEAGVRASGELSANSWEWFHWGAVSRVAIRAFESGRGTDAATAPDVPRVAIRYDTDPFESAAESGDDVALAKAAVDLLDLVEYAYAAAKERPRAVYGVSDVHRSRLVAGEIPPPVTLESLAEDRIEYACWLVGFPPAMVDTYGRDRIRSAPAWQTSELGDGGLIVLTTQNPDAASKPEARAVDQHLGLDPPSETEDCQY